MVYLDWIFKNNQIQLGFKLSICEEKPFSLFLLNLYGFVRSLSRFEFLRVFLLHMVKSIKCTTAVISCIR